MKGFTLVEVVVAVTLIGLVLLPLGRLYNTIATQMAARQQRITALQTLENQEAMLRHTPYASVAEGVVTLPVPALPSGTETVTVTPLTDVTAKSVAITLNWQSGDGPRHLDHQLILSPFGPEP
ncbi:MAG: prepilin-type N-terminal cleavage/methylation domain-containing protein [Candidatus Sericytochromatia bacterium]|nr:prepilin-type N-terminal cleavage/methylation domain-containing protein [Candidatus Sericytochromatia bacterium]